MDIFAVRDEDCRQTGLVQLAQPIRLRPHRLALASRQAAEDKIREMTAAGVIEPTNSPWAALAVVVKKKGDSWRFCVDYRRLNAVTNKDSYPLPRLDEALDYISRSSWFSSLDLQSGYWQVELVPDARPKTAFTIGQGLWQFRVMPFGLCHLHEVLSAIRQAGLQLNPTKCHLLARETRRKLLGHVVSAQGVATNTPKVAAVRDWPPTANVSELHSFLGLGSYYHRFVRDLTTIASPLHRLTGKGRPFNWDDACAAAFIRLKVTLTEAPILAYRCPKAFHSGYWSQ